MIEDVAQIEEMLLGGGPFFQIHFAPLGNELSDSHIGR
jgi:hypothetical protein